MQKVLVFLFVFTLGSAVALGQSKKRSGSSRKSQVTKTVTKTPPQVSPSDGQENGIDFVDLGLSVKWSLKNLGATYCTQEGGYYVPGLTNRLKSDGYDEAGASKILKRYSSGKCTLKAEHDAASKALGGSWRTPTLAEFAELNEKCIWTWVKGVGEDGKRYNGYIVKGPNGNSIFMPRPVCHCKDYEMCNTFYMCSTFSNSDYLMGDRFCVDENDEHYTHNYGVGFAYFVRAVCK